MKISKKTILLVISLFGFVVPFVPYLGLIEMFLIIPLGIIGAILFIYLIIALFSENLDGHKALFIFSIIPVFILSQMISVFMVYGFQTYRSENAIENIEKIKLETGTFPDKYDIGMGIEYVKIKDGKSYTIKYSRGFLVTERYDSKYKQWKSYGWND